ncbi:hypothetical protein NW762_002907 [Fusarium torreyae]|uniref:Uncharacterized protein n=1 Tax=Fusarium torreyae TaxID=1237075 RepID=A0A9W8VKK1_9HYPO|nr:hypothetical protein NW762_002907 [Fusarium torreyae]
MPDYPSPSSGGGMPFGQSQMNTFANNMGPSTYQETDQYDTGFTNGYMGNSPYSKEWILDGNVDFTNSSMLPHQSVGDGHQPFAQTAPIYNYSRTAEIFEAYAGMGISEKLMVEFAAHLLQLSDEEYENMRLYDPAVRKGIMEQYASHRADQKSFSDEPQTTSSVTLSSDEEDDITDIGDFESAEDFKRALAEFKSWPKPDLNDREACNQYLIRGRELRLGYNSIKESGGLPQTISTLRGRHRNLTKPPEERVRSPKWRRSDYIIMQKLVNAYARVNSGGHSVIPWARIAKEMWEDHGCSYKFCTATVARVGRTLADKEHNGRIPAGVV